jgi:hypothetical protein
MRTTFATGSRRPKFPESSDANDDERRASQHAQVDGSQDVPFRVDGSLAVPDTSGPRSDTIGGARKKDTALVKGGDMQIWNEESRHGSVLFCEGKEVGTAHEKGTP